MAEAEANWARIVVNKSGCIMSAWMSAVATSLRQNLHGSTLARFRSMPIVAELILAVNRFNL
jgi:hypothetical protein